MSLLTLRELISRLDRLLKSASGDSDTSSDMTEKSDPIHDVQLSAFSFTIDNVSYIVSFTIIPLDHDTYPSDRFLFRYYEHDPKSEKLIMVGKDYFLEEIEKKTNLLLALKASQKLSQTRIIFDANERENGKVGTETFDMVFTNNQLTYTKAEKTRYVSRDELEGHRVEYINRYSCPSDPNASQADQGTIESMVNWPLVEYASNIVILHPPIVNTVDGTIKWR